MRNVAGAPLHAGHRPDLVANAQLAGVAGLPAAARIEGGAVEHHAVGAGPLHHGFEGPHVAVVL